MPAINYDVFRIEENLNLLDNYLDSQSFQEVSKGGQPAVVLKETIADENGPLSDANMAGAGQFATGQLLTLTIPKGMRRVKSLKDPTDWNVAQGGQAGNLSKADETVRVQLLDRLRTTSPQEAYAGYRPTVNHYCAADRHKGVSKIAAPDWNRDGQPCSKPIKIGRSSTDYFCTEWDWKAAYAGDGDSLEQLMSRLFPSTEPLLLVGMMIPNRSVVWAPVPPGDIEEMHAALINYSEDTFFTLDQIVFLDGPDIMLSSEVITKAVLDAFTVAGPK
ncbi:MAG: hypothetical protein WA952_18830 [Lewinella sp.]